MTNMKTFLTLLLVILLATCKSPTSPDTDRELIIRITGGVTDSTTLAAIENASVQVYHGFPPETIVEARTDSEGRYYLEYSRDGPNCKNGLHKVGAGADGYRSVFIMDAYRVMCTADVQINNIQLDPL